MEIKTNFNIGDKIYYMHNNRVNCDTVTNIDIFVKCNINNIHREPIINVVYYVGGDHHRCEESEAFVSKEELIKSL